MSGRIRVLQVIQNLNYGGMERVLTDLARHVDPAEFEMHVMVLQYRGRLAEGLESVARVHDGPAQGRLSLLFPRALADAFRAIRPHVVHSHSGVWLKAARAARMARVPLVIHTEHGRPQPDLWLGRRLEGVAARLTDVVAVVTPRLTEVLRSTVVPRRTRIEVVFNGIDTDRFAPRPDDGRLRAELGLPADAPIALGIGRLEPVKGYDVMVRAAARLDAAGAPAGTRVVIAGDGSHRPALMALAEQLGVAGRVHWLSWRDDVEALHRAASLFTMSSRSEGTSISLLEAMSAGLCPVVTDVGGNRDVLGPDLASQLVPSDDPDALARAWASVLSDPARRTELGLDARRRVVEGFGVRQAVAKYEALYRLAVTTRS